jgi:hypothetical protein
VVFAVARRAGFLLGDPYPFGVDGYYYVVQARAVLETGQLNYPSAPLAFWWLAPFVALFGDVEGVKIGAAVGTALAVVPAYLLARRVSGARGPALLGAALVAASASGFFLTTEFIKEGLGLTVALAQIAATAAALARPSRARIGLAMALLAAAWLTHKSAAALALLGMAPMGLARLRGLGAAARRQVLLGLAALAAATVLLGVLWPGRFVGAGDARLVGDLFTPQANWSLPVLARARNSLVFDHEVALAGGLALAALALAALPGRPAARRSDQPRVPAVAVGFVLLALLAALPWLDARDVQGGAFRLRLAAFAALAPLAALVAARGLAALRVPADVRGLLALGAVCGLCAFREVGGTEGTVRTHPALVVAVRALDGAVPPGATVVTNDRKIAFMARYYARQPMRLHPDADALSADSYRLIPLMLLRSDLRRAIAELRRDRPPGVALPRGLHPWDEDGLLLIPEATFVYLLERVDASTRAHYLRWPTT